jgi:hypothetical protein
MTLLNPAIRAFVEFGGAEVVLGQVLLRRVETGFSLRHVADREKSDDTLQNRTVEELREIARFTLNGAFRPLKSAPNLRTGWLCRVIGEAALQEALERLYPGVIADWNATRQSDIPTTSYESFTGRQTGMYRVTAQLTAAQTGRAIRACCAPNQCLKRRFWTGGDVSPDSDSDSAKSLIPCLEPCPILLEFARNVFRWEQGRTASLSLTSIEVDTMVAALESQSGIPLEALREADFSQPLNSRRVEFVLDKMRGAAKRDEHEREDS